jgi:nicotinate-nucleotide pyrophosphorylase (carboxylating)
MSASIDLTPVLGGILNPVQVRKLIRHWLQEDQPAFDMQSLACSGKSVEAIIFCKTNDAILAGVPFVNAIANELQVQVTWYCAEGGKLGSKAAQLKGKAEDVLRMERVALNVMARCSGIATTTRRIRSLLNRAGWTGVLAGTRKTTPGFRLAEKYSLLIGGASQHRYDLSHMVMLKDNHIAICGSITESVAKVRAISDFASKIEVECSSLSEADDALAAGVDVIMLDNFQPEVSAFHNTA